MHRNTNLCLGTQRSVWKPNLFLRTLVYVQEPKLVFRNPTFRLGTQCYFQEPYVNV
jgi:hypothetical protein